MKKILMCIFLLFSLCLFAQEEFGEEPWDEPMEEYDNIHLRYLAEIFYHSQEDAYFLEFYSYSNTGPTQAIPEEEFWDRDFYRLKRRGVYQQLSETDFENALHSEFAWILYPSNHISQDDSWWIIGDQKTQTPEEFFPKLEEELSDSWTYGYPRAFYQGMKGDILILLQTESVNGSWGYVGEIVSRIHLVQPPEDYNCWLQYTWGVEAIARGDLEHAAQRFQRSIGLNPHMREIIDVYLSTHSLENPLDP